MAVNINLSGILVPNATSPLFDSSYPAGDRPNGLALIGTVAHGNALTLTDGFNRFGTRANVKPVYVNLGNAKVGSALGRVTADYHPPESVVDTVVKNGQLSGSIRRNHKGTINATNSIFGEMPVDDTKPIIHYVERYYDFDIASSAAWSDTVVYVPTVQASTLYRVTLNTINCDYTSSASPTALEISTGLRDAINANFAPTINALLSGNNLQFQSESTVMTFTASANLVGGYNNNSINLKRNRTFRSFGGQYADVYFSGDGFGSFMSTEFTPSQNNSNFLGSIGEEVVHTLPFMWNCEQYHYKRGSGVNLFDAEWRKYRNNVWQNYVKYKFCEIADMFTPNGAIQASTLYTITINGTPYNYTTDASPTGDEFVDGFAALINGDSGCPVTCSLGSVAANPTLYKNPNNWIWLTPKLGQNYPTISISGNITRLDYRLPQNQIRLDQISNRCARGSTTANIHLGYQIVDDEYKYICAGNAPTLAACTEMVPMPQTAWGIGSVSFQFVETAIPAANAYFYVCTGIDTYLNSAGIR
jgi:hypothetical protein